jgi:hypothetical protein
MRCGPLVPEQAPDLHHAPQYHGPKKDPDDPGKEQGGQRRPGLPESVRKTLIQMMERRHAVGKDATANEKHRGRPRNRQAMH